MLITVLGNDFGQKNKKQKEVLKGLKEKRPDAFFEHLDFSELDEYKIQECINTQGGFFDSKNIYLFSNIFVDKKSAKIFMDNLDQIVESQNAFVLVDEKIDKINLKKIEKGSLKFFEFNKNEKVDFNIFSLSDALQNRDKKKLWLLYHQALKSGLAAEQIYANFFFTFKSLNIALKLSLEESGLKAFPYKKAQSALKKWKESEVEEKFFDLVCLYNKSRVSGLNLKNALEKFILKL